MVCVKKKKKKVALCHKAKGIHGWNLKKKTRQNLITIKTMVSSWNNTLHHVIPIECKCEHLHCLRQNCSSFWPDFFFKYCTLMQNKYWKLKTIKSQSSTGFTREIKSYVDMKRLSLQHILLKQNTHTKVGVIGGGSLGGTFSRNFPSPIWQMVLRIHSNHTHRSCLDLSHIWSWLPQNKIVMGTTKQRTSLKLNYSPVFIKPGAIGYNLN